MVVDTAFAACYFVPFGISRFNQLLNSVGLSYISQRATEKIMFGLGHYEILIFLILAMVLFGSAKLPQLMRNLGRSAVEFKKGMREDPDESTETSKKDPVA